MVLVGGVGTGIGPLKARVVGPVRFEVSAKSQAVVRPFRHKLIVRETEFSSPSEEPRRPIATLCGNLARDARRNELILDDVIATIHEGRSPLVLTERREHVSVFSERLERYSRNIVVLTGGMGAPKTRETAAKLAALAPHEPRVVVATGRFVGEGFDDARLDTLFLTLPISWRGLVVQYAGRLHRLHPDKREVRIFDYVDSRVPMLRRMFERRLSSYRAIGYTEGELPPGFEALADPDYVYDEGRDEWFAEEDEASAWADFE